MSLDNIQLPSIVLENLYRKSLVDLKTIEPEMTSAKSVPLTFLGENLNRITILVESAGNAYLPEDELNFLTGVLNACKLNLADIALVNIANTGKCDYSVINESLKPLKIILLGIKAADIQLPFSVPDFQVQNYDSRKYLICPAIPVLMEDKLLKKKLWDALKLLFEIS